MNSKNKNSPLSKEEKRQKTINEKLSVMNEKESKFFNSINSDRTSSIFKSAKISDSSMRVRNGGMISNAIEGFMPFALSKGEYLNPDYRLRASLLRTASYTNPFNASVRSDIKMSLGMLTRAQKLDQKVNKTLLPKIMATGFAASVLYSAYNEDINPIGALADSALSFAALGGGMTIGRGIGGSIGVGLTRAFTKGKDLKTSASKMLGIGNGVRGDRNLGFLARATRLSSAGIGMVAGGIASMALYSASGISELLTKGQISDNEVNKKEYELMASAQYASGISTEDTMTMRQSAIRKMSMSGLNDRAMALGNEAMIYRSYL